MVWDKSSTRITGAKAVAARARWRRIQPLCVKCLHRGIIKQVDEVDHIIPLFKGGKDDETNKQSLCFDCHRIKTLEERSRIYIPKAFPDWIKPSVIPLTILVGPRCAGKNTYLLDKRADNIIIVDMDELRSRVTGSALWVDNTLNGYMTALRYRNHVLGLVSKGPVDGRGAAYYVLRGDQDEASWWIDKLKPTDVREFKPSMKVCMDRCRVDKNRPKSHITEIRSWYLNVNRDWKDKRVIGFDEDGNPLDQIE